MQTSSFFPAGIALAIALAGCSSTPPAAPDTRDADAKAIRQLEANWVQAWAAKDAAKIAANYADNASLFIPDMPIVTGKANIDATVGKFLQDKNISLSFAPTNVVVSKSGDLAYSQGTYTMTYTNPRTKKAVSETGKYVTDYAKQADGSWKAVADIDNADAPATPVKAKSHAKPEKKRHK
jgi:uncharacterized protein (TIGR02246 family)